MRRGRLLLAGAVTSAARRLPTHTWCRDAAAAHAAQGACAGARTGSELLEEHGALLVQGLLRGNEDELASLNQRFQSSLEECLELTTAAQHGRPLEVGTNYGWREVVQRARGRFDLTHAVEEAEGVRRLADRCAELLKHPLFGRPDLVRSGTGAVIATPGCAGHPWHVDGPHLFPALKESVAAVTPPHAVNVFVPLCDITRRNSPTEVLLGSHKQTNVERGEDLLKLFPEEGSEDVDSTEGMTPGDVLVFDYRVLHRALPFAAPPSEGEEQAAPRCVLYFTYACPWFKDIHNFPERSLFTPAPVLM